MINYIVNVNKLVKQWLSQTLSKPNRIALYIVLVAPLKWFFSDFDAFRAFVDLRLNYNSQQRSLAYLLNKVFETGTQIKVRTVSDTFSVNYLFGQPIVPTGGERVYLSTTNPFYLRSSGANLKGEIICPASLINREGEIRAWVDYVIFADKQYKVIFI